MNKQADSFGADAATLEMSNAFAAEALSLAAQNGGDPAAALIGAAMKVVKELLGDEHVVPVTKRFLQTIIASDGAPTGYN